MTNHQANESDDQANEPRSGETIGHHEDKPSAEGTIGAGQGNNSPDQLQRDPSDWATGDEPMTAAQKSYLDTLATEANEELPANLTKAQASEHIERLKGSSN